jgi:hypothetical protein
VGFDETFGEEQHVSLPSADPWPALRDAIQERQNWSAVLPRRVFQVVSISAPADSSVVLLDPVGGAELREKVLPLNRPITKFGEATPIGPDRYAVSDVQVGARAGAQWTATRDHFARAQFEHLSDTEKVSIPSFERMDAGVSVSSGAVTSGTSMPRELTYETLIIDSPWDGRPAPPYSLPLSVQLGMVRAGAAARAPFRTMGAEKFSREAESAAVLEDEGFVIASTADLSVAPQFATPMTKGDASLTLKLHLAAHPADRERLQVVAAHEAAA